ncbi:hypothetical protein [Sphaerotilus sp.]|uniref:hypothetical protein n=1 Tax=Sphaerotilus sp. TaxID=2093942 RepID=UPI00286E74AF|nr:hypothetical protein [Sphaerotilus sp.]
MQATRRRAAVSVFSDLLDETALTEALWLQHESMRGENVSDIIAFVDAVAQRNLLDVASVKRLYNGFYKALRESPERLPLDPWPAMQAARAAARPPAPPPKAVAPVAPVISPVINPVAAALAAAQAAVPVQTLVPEEPPVIFGALMRAIVSEVFQHHREALDEVRKDALQRLDDSMAVPALRQQFRSGWSRALQHDWQLSGTHADLAELTRVVYLALGDAFGRAGADHVLKRGLDAAEAVPEAKVFAPRRLLVTIKGLRI